MSELYVTSRGTGKEGTILVRSTTLARGIRGTAVLAVGFLRSTFEIGIADRKRRGTLGNQESILITNGPRFRIDVVVSSFVVRN